MGCASSTLSQTVADDAMMRRRGPRASMVAAGYKTELISDPASKEAQRLVASNGTVALRQPSAGLTLRYAFISQRGYYPDSPDKTNQDACTAERLGGSAGGQAAEWAGCVTGTLQHLQGAANDPQDCTALLLLHSPRWGAEGSLCAPAWPRRDAPVWRV